MKLRSTLLCASLGLAAVAGAHADTLAKVAQSGQITMAYRESSVPFSYLDKGKPVGMAVDISNAVVEAVKKAMGKSDLKVNWQAVTSQNRIPLLMNGTVDLECGSTTNNTTRAKDVDFAINHFYTGTRLLVKRSAGIKDYADLKGKTVAVTAGTTNLQVLRKANAEHKWELEMVTPKDHADAFLLVQNDRAAAFGMDDILLFGLISNSRSPADYEVVGQALQVEPYACMVRKDDPKFKALVDGVIGNLMKSGQFTQLYDKWFMQPIPPVNAALGLPMSTQLKQNLSDLSDKAAFLTMAAGGWSPPRAVGILGGMGPAAGADFVRLFVQACSSHLRAQGQEVRDQAFPEHWLVQMPIPDRSQALLGDPQAPTGPALHMQQGVGRLAALGVASIAMACNTAHVWHAQLQALFPQLHILHIAQETARHVQALGARQAIVLATAGTYQTGLYDLALRACGVQPLVPDAQGVAQLMEGIYQGVKSGHMALAEQRLGAVLGQMLQRYGDVPVIMGCTEIPLALPQAPQAQGRALVDPAWVLAQALVQRAYAPETVGVH